MGGSRGTLLAHLLQVLPDADGILLDRAEALAEAPATWPQPGWPTACNSPPGTFPAPCPGATCT